MCEIEDDMHGKQLISYKLIVYLKRSEKHIAKLNVILKINEKNTIPVFNAVNKYELTNTFWNIKYTEVKETCTPA